MANPVTHLEKTIAGEVQPVTHLEHVIAEYGGGGGGGGFTPTQAQLDAMNSGITEEGLETIENNILLKANTSDVNTATANLQAQINELITPVTQDAEVQNARVGATGIAYPSLKARLDAEYPAGVVNTTKASPSSATNTWINWPIKNGVQYRIKNGAAQINVYTADSEYGETQESYGAVKANKEEIITCTADRQWLKVWSTAATTFTIEDLSCDIPVLKSEVNTLDTNVATNTADISNTNSKLSYETGIDVYLDKTVPVAYTEENYVYRSDGATQSGGTCHVISVIAGQVYKISATFVGGTTFPVVAFLKNGNMTGYSNCGMQSAGELIDYELTIPDDGTEQIAINWSNKNDRKVTNVRDSITVLSKGQNNQWNGKRIVWYGTSIPAGDGGHIGSDNTDSYPNYVSNILGCTVYNEAIGSSAAHCKLPSRVSEANPYGFIGNFEAASRCLSNSIEEMQWICDHRNDDIWTSGKIPEAQWSEWWHNQILSYGYETKIDKYLTPVTFPDLFVFDHGHNDAISTIAQDEEYYAEYGEDTLFSFRGAMNFLIKRILNYNPHAKIVILSEYCNNYETDNFPVHFQKLISADWNIPILKQYEKLGWTKTKTITTMGHWVDGYWVIDDEPHTMTVFDSWIPDHIHPHSDKSRNALNKMARVISLWLASDVSFN